MVLSFIGGGNRSTQKKPTTCRKYQTNFEPSAGFKLTTLIVKATDCIGSYKSNYHTVMTTMPPGSHRGTFLVQKSVPSNHQQYMIYQSLVAGRWFSTGSLVFSINKTDHHDITDILLKVGLNTIGIRKS